MRLMVSSQFSGGAVAVVLKRFVYADELCACRIVARLEGQFRMARVRTWLAK
jgi:hypothetical protein